MTGFLCVPGRRERWIVTARGLFVILAGMRQATIQAGMAVLLAASVVRGQFESSDGGLEARKTAVKEEVRAWDEQNLLKFGRDEQYIVRPGLLVDKRQRTILVKGFATGLGSMENGGRGTEPVEFFLIGPSSGKGYEAVAVSLAQPSDIHRGLEAIGLEAGRPVNWARMQFWPKGERVKMTFRWKEANPDGTVSQRSARAEEMLVDRASRKPLPLTGLVFVGGIWVEPERPGGEKRYYADLGDPGAIASNYNEGTTVLDMPVQARQSEVYQTRMVNPANRLKAGTPVEVLIEPDSREFKRVKDVRLEVAGGEEVGAMTFSLEGQSLSGEGLIGAFQKMQGEGREPFVAVIPGEEMTLRGVRRMYALLRGLESDRGIRLEPPASGHLFHEAFDPDEDLRDWKKRIWQPVEVRFVGGVVVLRDYREEAGETKFVETQAESAEKLGKMLKERAEQRRPIAVFAPGGMRYGRLMSWIALGLTEQSVVWVYLE